VLTDPGPEAEAPPGGPPVDPPGHGPVRLPPPAHRQVEITDDEVSVDAFLDEMEQWRSEASAEQRTAWGYLGLLTVVFGALVVFGYVFSDQRSSDRGAVEPGAIAGAAEPIRLVFRVDGDVITLQGEVPDEAARDQLLARAQAAYGSENVIDQLTVNLETTLDEGTIRFVGSAAFGDERPQALQDAVIAEFGLANRGFEVGFVETVLSPVNAQVAVDDDSVTLSGALPDEQSVADLTATAVEVWGAANVDAAALTVGETTWTEGLIRLTGSVLPNDQRIDQFVGLVPERLGALVTVDTSALSITDITAELTAVQVAIDELLLANPIQFAPLSTDIDPTSDPTIVELANLVAQLPSVPFEVVGHTDSVGNDQENLVISQDRAQAVVDRLVELGVPGERMSSRGEGETKPIADNDTEEGKAANRRIEIILIGTSSG
jgi:outer membrane protein OmpA-like peptidoglycan-associated protein